jgi:hypothetical protein
MYILNYRTLRLKNPETNFLRVVKQGEQFDETEITAKLLEKLVRLKKVSPADGSVVEKPKTKAKSKGKK